MKVLKFGGTSVGDAERICETMGCVKEAVAAGHCAAVVVSAMGGVTDRLLAMASSASKGDETYKNDLRELETAHFRAIEALIPPTNRSRTLAWAKATINELEELLHSVFVLRECSASTSDQIASFGERLSAYIIAEALSADGLKSEYVDARQIIRTDESYGKAEVNFRTSYSLIRAKIEQASGLPIITGFIASTETGKTATLGRGGSDYTAAIIGAALEVDEIEIWTDVDGIMTADPRLVKTALPIPSLSFEEAMELSHFGAKILYPPTVQPALEKGIPIRIRNTMNPAFTGSVIQKEAGRTEHLVTGISSIPAVALLRVQGTGMQGVTGTAKRVFGVLAEHGINVILITQASSEHTICFAVMPDQAKAAQDALEKEFEHEFARGLLDEVVVETELSILSVVGEQMRHLPGLSGRLFQALGANGISVAAIAQGSSELNISTVIASRDRKKALNVVHDAFFLSDHRTAYIFIVGLGLIGKTLLNQLKESRQNLRDRYRLDLRVAGLANTKKMAFSEDGLAACSAAELPDEAEGSSLDGFIEKMLGMNLPHCVFVDCTAGDEVPERFSEILLANVSVVTPNKRALAGPLKRFKALKAVERRRGVHFLYETCVGAGLPIIVTLTDLIKSGDEIMQVEAVLSGTLSYIFNNYDGRSRFADVVRQAQNLGLTEPDPRDDLSGLDVGRKLLILAREIGWDLEFDEVQVENLVPPAAQEARSVEGFYEELELADAGFKNKLPENGQGKLCYLASVKDGKAKTSLQVVGPDHPFFGLSGSDNVIAFTTKRYSSRPLVVKGPGAGPDVTAAGVFADIIRVIQ